VTVLFLSHVQGSYVVAEPRPRRASLRRRLYLQLGVLMALWSFAASVTVEAGLSAAYWRRQRVISW
jgi:hypothetical protein